MKKKGFTLIELLAVIVILAIIALIATPLVLKYIETARKDTFKNSIESIERVLELKTMTGLVSRYPLEIDIKDLDLKNKDKLNGSVIIKKISKSNYEFFYDINDGEYRIYGPKDSEVYKLDKTVKLKLKTANGIIDDDNNFVYSFYESDGYSYAGISLSDYFDVENGTLEFQKSAVYNTNSTGAKIILKDKNNKVANVYSVIIFGDIDGDGWSSDVTDFGDTELYIVDKFFFDKNAKKAADMNADNIVNQLDIDIMENTNAALYIYNQITRTYEEIDY